MKEEDTRVRQHQLLETQRERDNLQLQLQQLVSVVILKSYDYKLKEFKLNYKLLCCLVNKYIRI